MFTVVHSAKDDRLEHKSRTAEKKHYALGPALIVVFSLIPRYPQLLAAITVVPAFVPCPAVNGVPTNSCFNQAGTQHVCCINPDSCGALAANGNPTCAAGNYYVF